MHRKLAIFAVALPLLAILGVLIDVPRPGEWTEVSADHLDDSRPPSWTQEPLPYVQPNKQTDEPLPQAARVADTTAAEVRMRTAMRTALDTDFQRMIGLSPGERQQRANDEGRAYAFDPAWPRIPALPEVSGFTIQVCQEYRVCVSDRLAEETDHSSWARPMESRIFDALSRIADDPPSQLYVVCRATTCGVLMSGVTDRNMLNLMATGNQLASELGFSLVTAADRSDFRAFYMTNGDGKHTGVFLQ